MESYTSRLATFSQVFPATKKRASDPKGKRALKWPHKTPTHPQLALAGFFYNPSSSCPDNVTCFLCNSNLDGWEETDDPVTEHLSHRGQCGWAVIAAIEQATDKHEIDIDDPTSNRMIEARRMTFATGWPHENKRGWLCKIQKMIDAGWHHAPTQESDDFVKCAYCSLSLDGWEPKDNPYQEHQRRSPDCLFFKAAAPASTKKSRSRKERASKASRLSTQSNLTTMSEAPSFADVEVGGDESMMSSAPAPQSKTKKVTKKSSRKQKASASQKPPATSVDEPPVLTTYLEPEDDDFSVKVDPSPEPIKRGKKRQSDQISKGLDAEVNASDEPPAKRRTTRTRSSVISNQDHSTNAIDQLEGEMVDTESTELRMEPKKGKKGGKKRGTSKTRKTSAMSNASKASLRVPVPDDTELDAALGLDLERPLTDEELEPPASSAPIIKSRRLTRTKTGTQEQTASVAPTRRTTRASTIPAADHEMVLDRSDENQEHLEMKAQTTENETLQPKSRGKSKKRATKKGTKASTQRNVTADIDASQYDDTTEAGATPQDNVEATDEDTKQSKPKARQPAAKRAASTTRQPASPVNQDRRHESEDLTHDQTAVDDSGHETDASTTKRGRKGKKKPASKAKRNLQRSQPQHQNLEDIVRPQNANDDPAPKEIAGPEETQVDSSEPDPPSKTKKPAKTSKRAAKLGNSGKAAQANPPVKHSSPPPSIQSMRESPISKDHATPAASPHSSNAENQPPSSMPSSARPPLTRLSPSLSQPARIPLAASTPMRSPSKNAFSKLHSTMPWTAVDLEMVFLGSPTAVKENLPFGFGTDANDHTLASPEKKMTVEQWIEFNAQQGEEKLRAECERLVGKFEGEGMRALKTLEGISCVD